MRSLLAFIAFQVVIMMTAAHFIDRDNLIRVLANGDSYILNLSFAYLPECNDHFHGVKWEGGDRDLTVDEDDFSAIDFTKINGCIVLTPSSNWSELHGSKGKCSGKFDEWTWETTDGCHS